MLEYYALAMMHIFNIISRVPRFLLMIASGGLASIVMRLLHKSQPQDANKKKQVQPGATPKDAQSDANTTVSGTTAVASSTATSTPKKSKQRKAGKK